MVTAISPSALEIALRAKVKEMLEAGDISCFIGYKATRNATEPAPVFVRRPEDAAKLIWNPFCRSSLAKYLTEFKQHPGKVGIAVKGCDSRSVVRLVKDNQAARDKVVVFSMPCPGILRFDALGDVPRRAKLGWELQGSGSAAAYALEMPSGALTMAAAESVEPRCLACTTPMAVVADVTLGDETTPALNREAARLAMSDVFADVAALEAMTPAERRAFWQRQFAKCIRCNACRNSCPACSCRECCFDAADAKWLGKGNSPEGNETFQVTRTFHVAGRCTGCGECDRACPVGIPLRLLNKKISKDMAELFATAAPGTDIDEETPFRTFSFDDPEEFM